MPKPRRQLPDRFSTRRRWSADDARAALAGLSASGLSTGAFAAREQIAVERLRRWRRQLAAEAPVAAAAPVAAFVEVLGRPAGMVEVVLRSGRVLRVSEAIEPEALRRMIGVLEELPGC